MRKKILGFVFAAALLMALALPLVGGVGTAQAGNPGLADQGSHPTDIDSGKALCGDALLHADIDHGPDGLPVNCP